MIALSVAKLKMFSPESEIFLWIKPKQKKKLFIGKFGSIPTFRSTRKGKKCFLWHAYVCLTTRCYTTSHLHQVLFDFARIFSLLSLVFRTSNFWSLRKLIKELFHSRLLDMRLVIANSALRASLAIYHLISNARSRNLSMQLFWATDGNRKCTFCRPRHWSLPDFQSNRLY